MHLRKFLLPVRLRDPRDDIRRRRGRLDRPVLMEDLDGGVIRDRRGKLERHQHRASRHERRDLGESLEISALVLPRRIAEVVERCAVLASEDVVQRRAQPLGALRDERILLADRLDDLALEHDPEVVHIHHDAGDPREGLGGECGRALPQQVVRQEERKRIRRIAPGEHGRLERLRAPAVLAHDRGELGTTDGLDLHRDFVSGVPSAPAPPARSASSSAACRLRLSSSSNPMRGTRPIRVSSMMRRRR